MLTALVHDETTLVPVISLNLFTWKLFFSIKKNGEIMNPTVNCKVDVILLVLGTLKTKKLFLNQRIQLSVRPDISLRAHNSRKTGNPKYLG